MKPRHAAALALVGWYLMTPPPKGNSEGYPNGVPNLEAPFKYWDTQGSFDSAKECNEQLQKDIELHQQIARKLSREHRDPNAGLPKGWSPAMNNYGLTAAADAQCIASDDPRLKGN